MKNLILASTSTVYGSDPLEYLLKDLEHLFDGCERICFIPYARPGGISYDDYTANVQRAFSKINIEVQGIHTFKNAKLGLIHAEGIFVGGGNTFVLLRLSWT